MNARSAAALAALLAITGCVRTSRVSHPELSPNARALRFAKLVDGNGHITPNATIVVDDDRINRGEAIGPRMFVAGYGLQKVMPRANAVASGRAGGAAVAGGAASAPPTPPTRSASSLRSTHYGASGGRDAVRAGSMPFARATSRRRGAPSRPA